MTKPTMRTNLLLLVTLLLSVPLVADTPTSKPTTQPSNKRSEKLSVTEHELKLADQTIKYKSTTGYLPIKDENGKERASFFFIAYEKTRGENESPATRPITYVFNGGPGAASVWLHLGTAGPQRVVLNDDGSAPAPPYRTTDNEYSWLSVTDLVFIDPVGTGYSRPAPGEKGEAFWGVREDVSSVADFIRLWTTKYERWASPKFLAGESYGTTRAAGLSQYLVDRYGISLNGIILVSSVLNFTTLNASDANDLPYPLFLPTYAAAAHHHKRLAPELLQQPIEKVIKDAEAFAIGTYTTALARGATLPDDQRKSIVNQLSRFTGLPASLIDKADLRVGPSLFRKELLAESRQIIGRFDSRIAGFDPEPIQTSPQYDPSLPQYLAAYSGAFNDYVRRTLKFESDLPYEVLSGQVGPWNWGRGNAGYLDVSGELRSAIIRNPHLRVMIASGYFDLATPHFATDYTVNRLDLSPDLRNHISQTYYMAGHMMYHNKPDLQKLHKDVTAFITSSTPKPQ